MRYAALVGALIAAVGLTVRAQPAPRAAAPVTFTKDVAPILHAKCITCKGWQLGEPDYIITLPLVNIPAEGKDYFPTPNLKIDLAEDHWIRALEIRPSNREVTHHSVIFTAGGGSGGGAPIAP